MEIPLLRIGNKLAQNFCANIIYEKIKSLTERLEISKICAIIKLKKENKFKAKIFPNIYFLCSMPPSVSLMLNFKHIGR